MLCSFTRSGFVAAEALTKPGTEGGFAAGGGFSTLRPCFNGRNNVEAAARPGPAQRYLAHNPYEPFSPLERLLPWAIKNSSRSCCFFIAHYTSCAFFAISSGILMPRMSASFLLITMVYSFWCWIAAVSGLIFPSRISAAMWPVWTPSL